MLYFAYTVRIEPDKLAEVAPNAQFEFIAHLPEWGLTFPIRDKTWQGDLPSVAPEPGSTVWGAVFSIPKDEVDSLHAVENEEQRTATELEAMDRTGRRHQVVTHVYDGNGRRNGTRRPSSEYISLMLAGSKHWSLPAGWIAGLEEHLESTS